MNTDVIRALLVEDNPGDARLLRELLSEVKSLRLRLLHTARLSEALEVLHQPGVDLLLLDLSLPDAHGVETVTRANAAAPPVPIVVLTGLDDEATAIRAMHAGAQDYLVKGQFDGQLLGRTIRYALERKRAEERAKSLLSEQAERAKAEEKRSRFLAEISRALASSLDYETTLSSVARLAVPALADCCLIDLLRDNGEIRRAASACEAALDAQPPPPGPSFLSSAREDLPAARALRTGEPVMLSSIPQGLHASLGLPSSLPPLLAAISLPLVARGRTLGAMTFLSTSRLYGPDDLALAGELAGRAALAVDNARLFRAREEILGVVSHDLRIPLTVIRGNIDLLRSSQPPPQAVDAIDRAAHQMSRLIQDLLDATRVDAGNLPLQPKRFGVATLLEDVEEALRPVADSAGVSLLLGEADGLPFLLADRDRILQVFWNLVGNAIKFTPKGGTVSLSASALPSEIQFDVSDTGPGIPSADLPRVFDRFWQGERPDPRGAGLGLSIARGIVEAHGGKIWVTSVERQGTTFSFTLPFAPP